MTASAPSTDARSRAWRAWGAPAAATAVGGVLAFVIGTLIAALVPTVSLSVEVSASSVLRAVASVQLALWLAGVVTLAVLLRTRARLFAILTIALAPVSTVIAVTIEFGGDLLAAGPLSVVVIVLRSSGMIGAAIIGVACGYLVRMRETARTAAPAAVMPDAGIDEPPTGPGRTARPSGASRLRGAAGWVMIAALVGGGALALLLPLQWFDVYFKIWGDVRTATPAQETRYAWTAGIGLLLLLLALAAAIVRRRAGLIVLASIACAVALIGAFVFQVPQGRFWPKASTPTYQHHGPVCFGTTGDCPGG